MLKPKFQWYVENCIYRIWLSPLFKKKNLNKYNRYLIPLPSFYAIKVIYYESLITVYDNEYSTFFMQITALMFYLISFDTFYVGNKIMVCINKLKNVNVWYLKQYSKNISKTLQGHQSSKICK